MTRWHLPLLSCHGTYHLSEVSRMIETRLVHGHKTNNGLILREQNLQEPGSHRPPTYVQMKRWFTNTCKTCTPRATKIQAIPVVLLHGQYRCHFGLKPTHSKSNSPSTAAYVRPAIFHFGTFHRRSQFIAHPIPLCWIVRLLLYTMILSAAVLGILRSRQTWRFAISHVWLRWESPVSCEPAAPFLV